MEIKHNIIIGAISGFIYPLIPGLLTELIGTPVLLSIMSTLCVLSGLIYTLILLSIISTPGSCIIVYIIIYIIANTDPINPYIIIILAPPS